MPEPAYAEEFKEDLEISSLAVGTRHGEVAALGALESQALKMAPSAPPDLQLDHVFLTALSGANKKALQRIIDDKNLPVSTRTGSHDRGTLEIIRVDI